MTEISLIFHKFETFLKDFNNNEYLYPLVCSPSDALGDIRETAIRGPIANVSKISLTGGVIKLGYIWTTECYL